MAFQIVHNDITNMDTDAIVNAANSNLAMGGGVCGAIFKCAGEDELQKACKKIGKCEVGNSVITRGYNLKAKYIIHTVGPIWRGGSYHEDEYLKSAYKTALQLAKENNIKSISFPLISSGIYGYPKKEALNIAVDTIKEFLMTEDMDIYLVVFDRNAVCLSEDLYKDISHYIDEFYEDEYIYRREVTRNIDEFSQIYSSDYSCEEISFKNRSLEDVLNNMDETFSEMVLRLIDEKGKSDVEVYKKANMDRKLFSKIRSNKNYNPKKTTVLSLAIAMELSLDETKDLLLKAGYSLSSSRKFDLIIEYFIYNKNYDIYLINEALFYFEQPLLAT